VLAVSTLGAIVGLVLAGRFILRPLFRLIGNLGERLRDIADNPVLAEPPEPPPPHY
jgi:hypothetical protein